MPRLALLVALVLLASGCARSYDTVTPEAARYINIQQTGPLTVEYGYHTLEDAGNERQAKKERSRGVYAVAVAVANHGETPVLLNEQDFRVSLDGATLRPMLPFMAAQELSQRWWPYAFWGLLSFSISTERTQVTLPIGIPIALFNVLRASSANKALEQNFRAEHLYGQTVPPSETRYGLIFLRDAHYDALTFTYEPAEDHVPVAE